MRAFFHQGERWPLGVGSQRGPTDIASSLGSTTTMNGELPANARGLVAVMNNRADFERAQAEHWYRIPVQSAPGGVRDIRWIALFAKLLKIRIRSRWKILSTWKMAPAIPP